jgi:hypothetical protein
MFNPGSGIDDCDRAWSRLACRKVYYDFFSYISKIRETRYEIEEAPNAQASTENSYPVDILSDQSIRTIFASYFVRSTYSVEEGENYPNSFEGDAMDYRKQPIVFVTKKRTPRHAFCQFTRPVHIDANRILADNNARISGRVNNNDLDDEESDQLNFLGGIVDFVAHQPIDYEQVCKKHNIANQQFSFVTCCLKKPLDRTSPIACIYIRAYLMTISEMICEGSYDETQAGNTLAMYARIGSIPIFQSYTIRDIYHRDNDTKFNDCMKNYGNHFFISFYKTNANNQWGNPPYFGAWFETLKNKNNKQNYLAILKLSINDLDIAKLGRLIIWAMANNGRIPDNSMRVPIAMQKRNKVEVTKLDFYLEKCTTLQGWTAVLNFVRSNGVISDAFLRAVINCRIRWCDLIKKMVVASNRQTPADNILVKEIIEKLKTIHYNKNVDVAVLEREGQLVFY